MTKEEEKTIENIKRFANSTTDTTVVTAKDMKEVLNLIQTQQEEIEKKDKIIDEAKKYCEQIMNYEKYEKKHSKLSRELVRIAEGLTTHYKMWRIANNINNILKGR